MTKVNAVENVVTVYRNYTLKFVFNYNRYSFTLDPGGTILRHQVRGDIIVDDPGLYRLERFGNYQEAHVNFRLDITGGNITGNYYNWHGERGEFEGRVGTDVATLTAKGHHFRGVRYRKATESQRRTEWTAITPLHYPTVNGLSPSW